MVKLKYTAKTSPKKFTAKKTRRARFKLEDARPFLEAIERESALAKWHHEQVALAALQIRKMIDA